MNKIEETVRQIIDDCIGTTVLSQKNVAMGYINTVIDAYTPEGSFIIKLHTDETALRNFQKESWCSEAAREIGIKTPRVDGVGTTNGYSWILQEKIEGVSGEAIKMDKADIYREMGRLAALVNTIPAPASMFGSWKSETAALLDKIFSDSAIQKLVSLDVLRADQVSAAKNYLSAMPNWTYPTTLSHADIYLDNLIVDKNNAVYIVDWGNARAMPAPYGDAGVFRAFHGDADEVTPFLEGYDIASDFSQYKDDIDRVTLLEILKIVVDLDDTTRSGYFIDRGKTIVSETLGS